MNLHQEIYALSHGYVCKGGKKNRNQQRKRMLAFAKFTQSKGVKSAGQLGKRQVIQYWKANTDLSDPTLYAHWLAICEVWRLLGKPEAPPEPFYKKHEIEITLV